MKIALRPIAIPDFDAAEGDDILIPGATYAARCDAAYAGASCDWVAVYSDREHFANIAFLTGFEPRFEEAMFLLGPGGRRVLITGNESVFYAPISPLPNLQVLLAQSMSLPGQDRSRRPKLNEVFIDAGIRPGDIIGVIGWKYAEPDEWEGCEDAFYVPALFISALRRAVGSGSLIDKTPILLHPEHGLRNFVDVDQIAAFERTAMRSSRAVWNVLSQIKPGEREREGAARMGYCGDPFDVHMMLASSRATEGPVIGLRSPTGRRLRKGDGVTTAVGYWGGLTARAGLLDDDDDAFVAVAAAYFRGLLSWYSAADIGVTGGEVFHRVTAELAEGGLRSMLNPGHLSCYEEWSHSPMRQGSNDVLRSGMHFQVDVIPVPMAEGQALNCEDTVVFADAALRKQLMTRHPQVYARIVARRCFMQDVLGAEVSVSVLPLSTKPLCLAPLWLVSDKLLAVA